METMLEEDSGYDPLTLINRKFNYDISKTPSKVRELNQGHPNKTMGNASSLKRLINANQFDNTTSSAYTDSKDILSYNSGRARRNIANKISKTSINADSGPY